MSTLSLPSSRYAFPTQLNLWIRFFLFYSFHICMYILQALCVLFLYNTQSGYANAMISWRFLSWFDFYNQKSLRKNFQMEFDVYLPWIRPTNSTNHDFEWIANKMEWKCIKRFNRIEIQRNWIRRRKFFIFLYRNFVEIYVLNTYKIYVFVIKLGEFKLACS